MSQASENLPEAAGMFDDRIQYEIMSDGRCSYCGSEAPMIELPDKTVDFSDRCSHCDQYNLEVLAESVE